MTATPAAAPPGVAPLVVVGDALLDRDVLGTVDRVCPDAPVPVLDVTTECARPGGAGLAALLAARHGGRPVVLVTALADDAAGAELAALLRADGVDVVDLGAGGATVEKVRVRAARQSLVRLDRGGAGPAALGPLHPAARRALAGAAAVLVADYGRGVAAHAGVRRALAELPRRVPVVWDPHPRGPDPVPGVHLVTPNAAEAAGRAGGLDGLDHADGLPGDGVLPAAVARAELLRGRWSVGGVVVTLGERGALLVSGDGPPLVAPAPRVAGGDACGAGDRFAVAVAGALADGAVPSEAVPAAVEAAAAFVAAGGAGAVRSAGAGSADRHDADRRDAGTVDLRSAPAPADQVARADPVPPADPAGLAGAVRARGGTVVATGGCFDLLHAGHVASLRAARALGDCLVVCCNSDASVRRLKGPGRPLQRAEDRAEVLAALDCVDAVVVFDEDTPVEALRRLRPHLFAKGGDYALGDLPESAVLAEWGGHCVVLPYLPGRSTTRLVEEARRRVH